MTINFNLFTPDKKQSAIRLVIYHKGKTYRKSTGVSCQTSDWSAKKQKCSNIKVEEQLKAIRLKVEEHLNETSSTDEIARVMDWAIAGDDRTLAEPGKMLFTDYLREWSKHNGKEIYIKAWVYKTFVSYFGDKVTWDEIDSVFMYKLEQKLIEHNLTKNSQCAFMSRIKAVLHEGLKLKYCTNTDFMDFGIRREEPDNTYLTEDEIKKLVQWRNNNKKSVIYNRTADLFLLGIYTAQRRSDVVRMSVDNIVGNTFRFTQQKTGTSVILPLSSKIKEIIERNGGRMEPVSNYGLYIKNICKWAGIDTPFETTKTVGDRKVTFRGPKWKFVGSHTARRTGATMLYKAGVPLKQCMMITGHKTEGIFLRYICISKEENAESLAKLEFFK